jgi:hypothetical protein
MAMSAPKVVNISTESSTAAFFIAKADIAADTPGGLRAAYSALGHALGLKGGGGLREPLNADEQRMFDEAHSMLGDEPTEADASAVLARIFEGEGLRGEQRRNVRKKLMRRLGFEL